MFSLGDISVLYLFEEDSAENKSRFTFSKHSSFSLYKFDLLYDSFISSCLKQEHILVIPFSYIYPVSLHLSHAYVGLSDMFKLANIFSFSDFKDSISFFNSSDINFFCESS